MVALPYEIGNIRKCLAAGFDKVISVVADKRQAGRRQSLIAKEIDLPDRDRVVAVQPDELFGYLDGLGANRPKESSVRGYAVKVNRGRGGADDERRRTIGQTMVAALKRLKRP